MQKHYKKFALIGTSCIGKTTMLKELTVHLSIKLPHKKIGVVPEAARMYFKIIKTNEPFSYTQQRNVQKLVMELESHMQHLKSQLILTDRSVIDAIAYVHAMGDKTGSQKLLQRVKKWIYTYDHFFLLDPKGIPYKNDKIRKESKNTRTLFHNAFLELLPIFKIPWTLVSGNKNQRLSKMSDIILIS